MLLRQASPNPKKSSLRMATVFLKFALIYGLRRSGGAAGRRARVRSRPDSSTELGAKIVLLVEIQHAAFGSSKLSKTRCLISASGFTRRRTSESFQFGFHNGSRQPWPTGRNLGFGVVVRHVTPELAQEQARQIVRDPVLVRFIVVCGDGAEDKSSSEMFACLMMNALV